MIIIVREVGLAPESAKQECLVHLENKPQHTAHNVSLLTKLSLL